MIVFEKSDPHWVDDKPIGAVVERTVDLAVRIDMPGSDIEERPLVYADPLHLLDIGARLERTEAGVRIMLPLSQGGGVLDGERTLAALSGLAR